MIQENMEDLLEKLEKANKEISYFRQRYQEGLEVVYRGRDEADDICCPSCGCSVSRNDEYEEMRPHNCPDCGTRLLY